MANDAKIKSDRPTKLSSVTAKDMATAFQGVVNDLTAVAIEASIVSVDYSGHLAGLRDPFKRPSKIRFDWNILVDEKNCGAAIANLESVSAQQLADAFAGRLSKIAGENYEAAPDYMRFSRGKKKSGGTYSVFVALSGGSGT